MEDTAGVRTHDNQREESQDCLEDTVGVRTHDDQRKQGQDCVEDAARSEISIFDCCQQLQVRPSNLDIIKLNFFFK